MADLIRMTKHGVNHVVRGKFTGCNLMLPVTPMAAGTKRLCVGCKRNLTDEEKEALGR